MKLKCDKHNRRVVAIHNVGFIHRNGGNPRTCDGKKATIGDNTFTLNELFLTTSQKEVRNG